LLALENRVTAVFAANNRQCVGVLRAIRASQRQIALVGFDDFELADLLPIPVSVIGFDPAELGRAAAELLFSRLAGDNRPPQRIVIPTRLIQRGSGEIVP
jgi:LacI family transcriptional regulator